MRTYTVKAGDSPAGIASRDDMAGCPKCTRDLVYANPGKPIVTYPNGFVSFRDLRVDEVLALPEKWFDPAFELLPPAYFGSLPYADGVTPSPFGALAPVILRDFRALDVAADKLRAIVEMGDQAFAKSIPDVAEAIDSAVQPALGRSQYAQAASNAIGLAIPASKMLTAFAASGLPTAQARAEVLQALRVALNNAQRAIGEVYATIQPPVQK
jgi:hypothetical protein